MAEIMSYNMEYLVGNTEAGTYAFDVKNELIVIGFDRAFILVKRYGEVGEDFTYLHVSNELRSKGDKILSQRACEPAEIDAAKAKIAHYTPGELTQRGEYGWEYQVDQSHSWHVTNLGQEGEKFWKRSPDLRHADPDLMQENKMSSAEVLKFKAVLGIEDFEADYVAQYSGPLVKSAGKK